MPADPSRREIEEVGRALAECLVLELGVALESDEIDMLATCAIRALDLLREGKG